MKKFLTSLTPEDVLGFIVVIGCFVLKLRGVDNGTDNVMTAIVAYRLGHHAAVRVTANARKKQ